MIPPYPRSTSQPVLTPTEVILTALMHMVHPQVCVGVACIPESGSMLHVTRTSTLNPAGYPAFAECAVQSHQQHLTLSPPCSCAPILLYLQQGEGDGPAMDLVRTVASVTDWATAAGVVPRVSAIIACACPPHALASVALQDDLGSSSRDHVRDGYVLQNVLHRAGAVCAYF